MLVKGLGRDEKVIFYYVRSTIKLKNKGVKTNN